MMTAEHKHLKQRGWKMSFFWDFCLLAGAMLVFFVVLVFLHGDPHLFFVSFDLCCFVLDPTKYE